VEPGNIFKRTGGIKMEDRSQELLDSLEFVEVLTKDKDGNLITKKIY
jgi:hypothetical protein